MEVYSDTDSINKIMRQLKKDQKKIESEINKFRDDPGDIGVKTLNYTYIIDCYGEHRFDVTVECRKALNVLDNDNISNVTVIVKEYGYDKKLEYTTSIVIDRRSIDSIYVVIFGIIMAQWEGLFCKYL